MRGKLSFSAEKLPSSIILGNAKIIIIRLRTKLLWIDIRKVWPIFHNGKMRYLILMLLLPPHHLYWIIWVWSGFLGRMDQHYGIMRARCYPVVRDRPRGPRYLAPECDSPGYFSLLPALYFSYLFFLFYVLSNYFQMCGWRPGWLWQLAGLWAEALEVQWAASGHGAQGERQAGKDVQAAAETDKLQVQWK